jgi:hypothetical protein
MSSLAGELVEASAGGVDGGGLREKRGESEAEVQRRMRGSEEEGRETDADRGRLVQRVKERRRERRRWWRSGRCGICFVRR